jgi:hypothetical protein
MFEFCFLSWLAAPPRGNGLQTFEFKRAVIARRRRKSTLPTLAEKKNFFNQIKGCGMSRFHLLMLTLSNERREREGGREEIRDEIKLFKVAQ